MKKLFYLIVLLGILTQSCVDQASDDIVFTIFNQTNENVKVLGFNNQLDPNTNGKADPIIIRPNSNFKVTRVTGLNDDIGFAFYSIQGIDSVRVIFNNEKVKVYGTGTALNPCDICDGGDDNQHFITEENYNTAEDCNGNCD